MISESLKRDLLEYAQKFYIHAIDSDSPEYADLDGPACLLESRPGDKSERARSPRNNNRASTQGESEKQGEAASS